MTIKRERVNAVRSAYLFLVGLMDERRIPRVPRSVRMLARAITKHYPTDACISDNSKCWMCGHKKGKKK